MLEMSRENAREIKEEEMEKPLASIDKAVEFLTAYRERGESVYIVFNGHKLYSCDVTIDSAYKEIMGMTKVEFDAHKEAFVRKNEEKMEEETTKARKKIPDWIERGKLYIYPELWKEWEETVEDRVGGTYPGLDLDGALEIMEKLEKDPSMKEAEDALKSLNPEIIDRVRGLLLCFAKKGPDFYKVTDTALDFEKSTRYYKERQLEIERIEIRNKKLEKGKLKTEISRVEEQIKTLEKIESAKRDEQEEQEQEN